MVKVNTGKEKVSTIQLKLKSPKTSRSLPTKVVELPELGDWFCPVRAYKVWQRSRKGKQSGSQPFFTWRDDSLVTLEEVNAIIEKLYITFCQIL